MELSADASPYGLGAVIMDVYPSGTRRPIACASQTLNEHERRYGQIDKEALEINFGLKRLHVYLYGRHFTTLTDHKPLERIFVPKTAINDGQLFLQPSITVLNLCRPSKPQWQTHYHAYLYRRRLAVRAQSSKLRIVWYTVCLSPTRR